MNGLKNKKMTKEKNEPVKITLEERRLVELRKEINNNELLDEYTAIYVNFVMSHAATLRMNFDNLKSK